MLIFQLALYLMFDKVLLLWAQTKDFLARNAAEKMEAAGTTTLSSHDKILAQLPEPGTKMTAQELSEVDNVCWHILLILSIM